MDCRVRTRNIDKAYAIQDIGDALLLVVRYTCNRCDKPHVRDDIVMLVYGIVYVTLYCTE